MIDPRTTYTLTDFINIGKSSNVLSYANMSFIETRDNIEYVIVNILGDYLYELKLLSKNIQLNERELYKYKYNPKLLANDIYDNPELGFVILLLNDMCNVKEFDIEVVKLLNKQDMEKVLADIYNSEKMNIQIYNQKK